MGSTTLQTMLSVGTFVKGSSTAVAGSGTTIMSLLSIDCHPRMDDPSNPEPSVKTESVNSSIGIVKCCQVPGKSTNFRSTMTTLFFFANSSTSFDVITPS